MRVGVDGRVDPEYVAAIINGNLAVVSGGDAESPPYRISSEPRVMRVGRYFGRTGIDKLSQLSTVLKDDIGPVGPRLSRPHSGRELRFRHLNRLPDNRAGTTGRQHVKGRS